MFDHTITDMFQFTGDNDLAAASLTFTSLDHERHAVIDAHGIGDDGIDTLARFLDGEGMANTERAARMFRDAWEHGFAREAVSMLADICTIRLDFGVDLTGQVDRRPAIVTRLTITDKDVREYVSGQNRVPKNIAFHHIVDELRQSEDADAKRRLKNLILGGCMKTVF